MSIAAHSVVVEFRMLARPLLMCCSPQAIRTQGRSALVIAMMMNGTIRAFQKSPNSRRPVTRMITASVSAPEADLTSTSTVGLMSWTPSLMKRNDAPQISASATNATYGRSGFLVSDTRRPIVRREDERDGSVVFDAHPHHGSKASGLSFYSALPKTLHEQLIQLRRPRGIARLEQAGPAAPAHIREQGELRNDERGPTDVDEAEVHPSAFVGEHAEVDDLVRKPVHRVVLVIRSCTNQQHEPMADGCTPQISGFLPAHRAGGHALRDYPQERLIDLGAEVGFRLDERVDVAKTVIAVLQELGRRLLEQRLQVSV